MGMPGPRWRTAEAPPRELSRTLQARGTVMSARDRLRKFFEENVGKVVHTSELREVSRIVDHQRRIRELRNIEGMDILTHNDSAELKPGEYKLASLKRTPRFTGGIGGTQRARILQRNGMTCQICGAGAGEPDPLDPRKKVRLNVDHIVPLNEGGKNDDTNLRVTCSTCNLGRSNLFTPPEERSINLLANIRRAPKSVQRELYEFLKRKFEME